MGQTPDRNRDVEPGQREPGLLRQLRAAVVDRVVCWRSAWNRSAETSATAQSSRHNPRKSFRSRWFIFEIFGYDMTCRESALTANALDARGVRFLAASCRPRLESPGTACRELMGLSALDMSRAEGVQWNLGGS